MAHAFHNIVKYVCTETCLLLLELQRPNTV